MLILSYVHMLMPMLSLRFNKNSNEKKKNIEHALNTIPYVP